MRNSEKQGRHADKTKVESEDDVDALFRLALAEFTGARNSMAARLKKSGRGDEANFVKALAKPSISAWAVNQLYWNHRETFDRLIVSGERFHKAQSSRLAGKLADMREALDARREALAQLSDLATSLLQEAGHNPTLDIIRRITTTLEAVSVYASRSDAPRLGRLTHDVDPPGFESLASFTPATAKLKNEPARFTRAQKSSSAATTARRKVSPDGDVRQLDEKRNAKIGAARTSLKDAKRSLTEAQVRAQRLEAAQKYADAEAKKAEKSLKKARAASEAADRRARSAALELEEAAKSVKDAERTFERASEEFEKLSRESSGR